VVPVEDCEVTEADWAVPELDDGELDDDEVESLDLVDDLVEPVVWLPVPDVDDVLELDALFELDDDRRERDRDDVFDLRVERLVVVFEARVRVPEVASPSTSMSPATCAPGST
jgi:hypothetical protein